MKKTMVAVAAICLLAAAGQAQQFSLKIGGGLGYASGGDLTNGIKGQNAFLAQEFQAGSAFLIPHTGVDFAGEFVYYPWTHFGIGIGGGYFQTLKQSSVSYAIGAIQTTETIKPQINVVPITLNLHWLVFLSSWLHLDVSAGAGSYSTTLKWDYQNAYTLASLNGNEHYTFQARASAIGFQAGLGLDFAISSRISVVLDFVGRSAKIGPFSAGDWTDAVSGSFGSSNASGSDHSFWIYNWLSGSQTYAQVAFQADQPKGSPFISGAQTGKIDLSGFAATIGIRLAIGRI
jgi:hypothetical protein